MSGMITEKEIQHRAEEYEIQHRHPLFCTPSDIVNKQLGYIAGFKDGMQYMAKMDEREPDSACTCLVQRNLHGRKYFEILNFDGDYWVTGLHDDPDSIIERWIDLSVFENVETERRIS